jgi:hypothetical protein
MLYDGLPPQGLTSELNQRLNSRLHQARHHANRGPAGHGAGCRRNSVTKWRFRPWRGAALQHPGRIGMFKQDADLFDHYLDAPLRARH